MPPGSAAQVRPPKAAVTAPQPLLPTRRPHVPLALLHCSRGTPLHRWCVQIAAVTIRTGKLPTSGVRALG